jgi:protein-disulfide isomerase
VTSGKASRKAKRSAHPANRRPTSRAGRQASTRALVLGGGVVATVIVAVVLGVLLSGGSSTSLGELPAIGSLDSTNLSGAREVEELLKGIPQSGATLGRQTAPVTMTQFIDLQCPACQVFETTAFTDIVEKWVRPGKLRIETEAWAFIGPDSVRGQKAVIAAGSQDKAYNFTALLYINQGAENAGWLDDEMVGRVAASIPGMDVRQLLDQRNSSEVADRIDAVAASVDAQGVNSTPTLFVGKTGEKGAKVELASLEDAAPIDEAVQRLLSEG